jgi:hypothetical protein
MSRSLRQVGLLFDNGPGYNQIFYDGTGIFLYGNNFWQKWPRPFKTWTTPNRLKKKISPVNKFTLVQWFEKDFWVFAVQGSTAVQGSF